LICYLVMDDWERSPLAAFSTHAAAWAYIDGMPEWQRQHDRYDVEEFSVDFTPAYSPEPKLADPTLNAALTGMAMQYFQPEETGHAGDWLVPPPKPPK
jgi:hypothetical protein